MKLRYAQPLLDAGHTLEVKDSRDGYIAAYKSSDEYVSVETFEVKKHPTFEALLDHLEPDREAGGEYDTWDIEAELTDEQKARGEEIVAALEAKDDEALLFIFRAGATEEWKKMALKYGFSKRTIMRGYQMVHDMYSLPGQREA